MPALNEHLAAGGQLNRIMAYGPSQSRKTWWAGTIAEAGYNVLFVDSDGNPDTLRNLSPAAQERIYYVNVQDTRESAVAAEFWTMLLKHHFVWYDEKKKSCYLTEVGGHTCIDVRDWDGNFVIINDSYTGLAGSVAFRYSLEQNIDLEDAKKTEWDGYGWCGRLLSWMLESMKKLPCHLITVGHATQYEKKKNTTDTRGRVQQTTEWTRRQPVSCSGPHGMQVGRCFGETYYMYQKAGAAFIEPFGDQWADGGSRRIERKALQFDQFAAWQCFDALGTARPPEDLAPIAFVKSEMASLQEQMQQKAAARQALVSGLGTPAPLETGVKL